MSEFKLTIPKEIAGKPLQFKKVEEFQAWLTEEISNFEWLAQQREQFSRHVWSYISKQFSIPQGQLSAIQQNLNAEIPIDGNIEAIRKWFEKTYKNNLLILSTSPTAKVVNNLKEKNPKRAASFLGHLFNVQNLYGGNTTTTEMIEGAFEYFNFANGMSGNDLLAEKQSLEQLRNEWEEHLLNYKAKEDELETEFKTTKVNFDKYFKDTQIVVEQHLKKHTDDLEELKKTYDQYMALKAPVEYWKNKRQNHKENANIFKKWSIGTGTLGAIAFSLLVLQFFSDNILSYWKVGIFVFLGTLFFWAMRVLVKLMLSHIHLEGDAHEREVMCQTYLALLRDKIGLEENDKRLILATLFRPSSSGIMGEDGIPPGLYDVMTKFASK